MMFAKKICRCIYLWTFGISSKCSDIMKIQVFITTAYDSFSIPVYVQYALLGGLHVTKQEGLSRLLVK